MDEIKLRGVVTVTVQGDTVEVVRQKNLITDDGLRNVIYLLGGLPNQEKIAYLALGTGSGAVSVSSTQLEGEVMRSPATISTSQTNFTDDTLVLTNSFIPSQDYTLNEAGIFTVSSGGTLFSRVVFASSVVASAGVGVDVTWNIVVGR